MTGLADQNPSKRSMAVVNVFVACAVVVTRDGRTYDAWVSEVTKRFKRAWRVIDA